MKKMLEKKQKAELEKKFGDVFAYEGSGGGDGGGGNNEIEVAIRSCCVIKTDILC